MYIICLDAHGVSLSPTRDIYIYISTHMFFYVLMERQFGSWGSDQYPFKGGLWLLL